MLFATLGKLDLLTVIILLGAAVLPKFLLGYAAIYLIVKGLAFILLSRDLASYGDLFSGVYLYVLSHGIQIPVLHGIVIFYLGQKTALTFVAIGIKMAILYYEYRSELPAFLR